jgi:Kinesin motor domain
MQSNSAGPACSANQQRSFRVPWLPPEAAQEDFYESTCHETVAAFINKANCDCGILAYGATGSGKTYSTQGTRRVFLKPCHTEEDDIVQPEDGVLQRALQQVFQVCDDQPSLLALARTNTAQYTNYALCGTLFDAHNHHAMHAVHLKGSLQGAASAGYVVCISAVEIYMERMKDLLATGGQCAESELVADGERVTVRHKDRTPLREVRTSSVADAMHNISGALRSRMTRATRCAAAG